jgi:excisionase family DNA binding protein
MNELIDSSPDPLLSANEVAELLKRPKRFVYRAVEAHALPAVRLGRSLYVRHSSLRDWLQQNEGVRS